MGDVDAFQRLFHRARLADPITLFSQGPGRQLAHDAAIVDDQHVFERARRSPHLLSLLQDGPELLRRKRLGQDEIGLGAAGGIGRLVQRITAGATARHHRDGHVRRQGANIRQARQGIAVLDIDVEQHEVDVQRLELRKHGLVIETENRGPIKVAQHTRNQLCLNAAIFEYQNRA